MTLRMEASQHNYVLFEISDFIPNRFFMSFLYIFRLLDFFNFETKIFDNFLKSMSYKKKDFCNPCSMNKKSIILCVIPLMIITKFCFKIGKNVIPNIIKSIKKTSKFRQFWGQVSQKVYSGLDSNYY